MTERWTSEHVERLRRKAQEADGLGPFWKGMMLAALDAVEAERNLAGKFGVALMMIREGAAEPREFAARMLSDLPLPATDATLAERTRCASIARQWIKGAPTTTTENVVSAIAEAIEAGTEP